MLEMLPLLAFLALASPQDCHNFGTVSTCTTSLPPSQPCGWCEKTHDGVPKCEACAAGPGCDKPSASWSACSQSAANVTLPPSPSPLPSAWVPNYYLHIETGMDVAKSALSCGFDQFDYESAEKVDVACTSCCACWLSRISPPRAHSILIHPTLSHPHSAQASRAVSGAPTHRRAWQRESRRY